MRKVADRRAESQLCFWNHHRKPQLCVRSAGSCPPHLLGGGLARPGLHVLHSRAPRREAALSVRRNALSPGAAWRKRLLHVPLVPQGLVCTRARSGNAGLPGNDMASALNKHPRATSKHVKTPFLDPLQAALHA